MAVTYESDGRPRAQSKRTGPDSPRDRQVDLELPMGALGCGDLIYELREQFMRTEPRQLVRVVSDDPGAPLEIPAWCRSTRHILLEADPPYYVIQVRDE